MGMSYSLVGVKPGDAKWQKMKDVYDACAAADLPIPREVEKFFEFDVPHPDGVTVNLVSSPAVAGLNLEYAEGFRVELEKLPPDIKILVFKISY